MLLACQRLYQVPMCGQGQVSHDLDRAVVGSIELFSTFAEQIPYLASSEVAIVDFVEEHLGNWVGKEEFLVDIAVLVNISGQFLVHISLSSIYLVAHHVPQVQQPVHTW